MMLQLLASTWLVWAAFCRLDRMDLETRWPVRWLIAGLGTAAAAIGISPWVWAFPPNPWVSALLLAQCLLMMQPRQSAAHSQ